MADIDLAKRPSLLLSPRNRVIPLTGRQSELAYLTRWRDEPRPGVSVRLIHAPAGQGKTRLALEFAEQCQRAGWRAESLEPGDTISIGPGQQPLRLLLVVEDADRLALRDLAATLLACHHSAPAGATLRILVLARRPDWWPYVTQRLADGDLQDTEQVALPTLMPHPDDRVAVFETARRHFAAHLGHAETAVAPPDLGHDEFGQVLTVHMAALAATLAAAGDEPELDQPAGVAAYLLRCERELPNDASTDPDPAVTCASYIATLIGPADLGTATTALTVGGVASEEATVDQILAEHRRLYPPQYPDNWLEPLTPPRLAEDFLALSIPGHDQAYPADPWASNALHHLLTPGSGLHPGLVRQAFAVAINAARRWPHLATNELYPLLREHPNLARSANVPTLLALIQLPNIDTGLLEEIRLTRLSAPTADDSLAFAILTMRIHDTRLAAATSPAERADLYMILANNVKFAGLWEQAFTAGAEAVRQYRLAFMEDPARGQTDRATALEEFIECARHLGRADEVLQATDELVQVYRRLAASNPDWYDSRLAITLDKLAAWQSASGRDEQATRVATEAVAIFRRLAATDPAYELGLANALKNLSSWSGKVQPLQALQAVQEAAGRFQRLAAADTNRHEPEFAAVLSQLAVHHLLLNQAQLALQPSQHAVAIYRRLTQADLKRHQSDFALALAILGDLQDTLNHLHDAVATRQEVVWHYRALSARDRSTGEPMLAHELGSLGRALAKSNQDQLALAAFQESVEIYRALEAAQPGAHTTELLQVLSNLTANFARLGRYAEAMATSGNTVRFCRQLVAADPAAFELELADANFDFAVARNAARTALPEAHAAILEAIDIYQRYQSQRPAQMADHLSRAHGVLSAIRLRLGQS